MSQPEQPILSADALQVLLVREWVRAEVEKAKALNLNQPVLATELIGQALVIICSCTGDQGREMALAFITGLAGSVEAARAAAATAALAPSSDNVLTFERGEQP